MIPFYFRDSDKPLFGIYHPPSGGRRPHCGVVICHPVGHEYINGYRALRQLAHRLARVGYSVLRFDYQGCGDSSGDTLDASLSQWRNDIHAAIREIQSRGASTFHLVGARLGATLALQVAVERKNIETVVLWDPVVNGKQYLDSLAAQHQEWLGNVPLMLPPLGPGAPAFEALGLPMNTALKDGLEQLDLLKGKPISRQRLMTLETDPTHHGALLAAHLESIGAVSEYRFLSLPRVWRRKDGADNVVVPIPILQAITDWIAGMPS